MKTVGFVIKIPLARETTDTQKALAKQRETVVGMQKKDLPALTKATKEYLKTAKTAAQEAEQAAEKLGSTFERSMETGLRGVNRFTTGIGKLKGELFNLKTALAGTAIGVGAIWAGRKLYEGGKQQLATTGRINREFGDDAVALSFQARRAGRLGGISEDEATKGLIPFRERLDDIEAGAQFRGMKNKLTAGQASALRDKNLGFGASLLARVSTLSPDLDQGQVGGVLADALSGPEGVRRLITEFNLSKRSKTVAAANEKGDVFKFLRDDEKKKYGVTKKGQYLEQGDLVNILLERSGITEGAAEAKRKKLDFQIKAIGAEAENALADIGAKALEKFNGGMAKGATLSEKFENAIKSKEGQKVLDSISTTVVDIAEGAVKVATTLPKIGSFLSEHKTALLALGGAFLTLKGASAVGGMLNDIKGVPGVGGLLGGKAGAPIPVYVVNNPGSPGMPGSPPGGVLDKVKGFGLKLGGVAAAGGVGAGLLLTAAMAAAGYGGYKAGNYLGKHVKPIGKMHDAEANWLYGLTGEGAADKKTEEFEVGRNKSMLDVIAARVAAKTKQFEAQGMNHGVALYYAQHPDVTPPPPAPTQVTINLDGQKIAEVVSKHQGKAIDVAGARGAAPTHRE